MIEIIYKDDIKKSDIFFFCICIYAAQLSGEVVIQLWAQCIFPGRSGKKNIFLNPAHCLWTASPPYEMGVSSWGAVPWSLVLEQSVKPNPWV